MVPYLVGMHLMKKGEVMKKSQVMAGPDARWNFELPLKEILAGKQ